MKIISHRGNLDGRLESWENEPTYIDNAIKQGFDVEIDVWFQDDVLYLGHDKPMYGVDFRWFRDRLSKLWIHCKNLEAAEFMKTCGYDINYFWHQNDDFVLTSGGYFWTYPGKKLCSYSIAVLPELVDKYDMTNIFGICTDYPNKYGK